MGNPLSKKVRRDPKGKNGEEKPLEKYHRHNIMRTCSEIIFPPCKRGAGGIYSLEFLGSNPNLISNGAWVAELVDARDLKSLGT